MKDGDVTWKNIPATTRFCVKFNKFDRISLKQRRRLLYKLYLYLHVIYNVYSCL